MSKGTVYILTNEWFKDDCVKIGMSSQEADVRANGLYTTGVPVSFEVYAELKTEKFELVEKMIHNMLEPLGYRINPQREFFQLTPDKALGVLLGAAQAFEDAEVFKYEDGEAVQVYPVPIVTTQRTHKPKFKFSMIDLVKDDELIFIPTGISVKVSTDKTISYEGREYTTTSFTRIFLPEEKQNNSGRYAGPRFFSYKGIPLDEIRDRFESGEFTTKEDVKE